MLVLPRLFALAAVLTTLSTASATPISFHKGTLKAVMQISADGWTNARRLAGGLPPLPPKIKRTRPGEDFARARARGLASPSASPSVSPSPKPSPSATLIKHTGHIAVRNASHFSYGFIGNFAAGVNSTTTNATEALEVTFSSFASGAGPFKITAEHAAFPGPHTIGAVGTIALGSDSSSIVRFGGVNATAPLTRPGVAGGESHIWSFNTTTGELTAQWINPNGSRPHTAIALDIPGNNLFFTENVTAYNLQSTVQVVEVHFILVKG